MRLRHHPSKAVRRTVVRLEEIATHARTFRSMFLEAQRPVNMSALQSAIEYGRQHNLPIAQEETYVDVGFKDYGELKTKPSKNQLLLLLSFFSFK